MGQGVGQGWGRAGVGQGRGGLGVGQGWGRTGVGQGWGRGGAGVAILHALLTLYRHSPQVPH